MIAYLAVLVSAIAACVAAYAAHISNEKFRLDLYNKRFDIYSVALEFFNALTIFDPSKDAKDFMLLHNRFIKSREESWFLFGKDSGIYELLGEMNNNAFKITGFKKHGKALASCLPEFIKAFEESGSAWRDSGAIISKLKVAMEPYLNFQERAAEHSFTHFVQSILSNISRHKKRWTQ